MRIESRSPLNWPEGWPRKRGCERFRSSFGPWTISRALDELAKELERLRCDSAVISANATLRGAPLDPGVAVYFRLKGSDRVLACDVWQKVEENVRAITKHIEALRGQQRWGVGSIDQAFAGYTAIPEKTGGEAWHMLLGCEPGATEEQIRAAWREKAKLFHPDVGGSNEQMTKINAALEQGLLARKAQ